MLKVSKSCLDEIVILSNSLGFDVVEEFSYKNVLHVALMVIFIWPSEAVQQFWRKVFFARARVCVCVCGGGGLKCVGGGGAIELKE